MLNTIKIFINSQLYAMSLYARQIDGTVVLLLVVRYLSIYDYGLYSSYANIAGFLFLFANLGFSDWIIVSSKAETKEVKLKIALFVLNAIMILVFGIVGSIFFNIEHHIIYMLVTLRVFFDGVFFALILPYFQASKKFNTIAIINIIYSLGVAIIAVVSYIYKLSLAKFLILSIILGFVNFIQCTTYIRINYVTVLLRLKEFIKYIDKTIIDFILVRLACVLYLQIQPLFVATYLPKESAALYFSANTLATIVALFIAAVQQKLLPELIKAKVSEIKSTIKKNIYAIYCVIMLIFLIFIFAGKFLLIAFYGKEYYGNGYPILLLLTIANLFTSTILIYGTYITSSGNQRKKLRMQGEAMVVALISLFGLKQYGIYGAACSYLITAIYLAVRYYTFTKNLIKKNLVAEGEKNA